MMVLVRSSLLLSPFLLFSFATLTNHLTHPTPPLLTPPPPINLHSPSHLFASSPYLSPPPSGGALDTSIVADTSLINSPHPTTASAAAASHRNQYQNQYQNQSQNNQNSSWVSGGAGASTPADRSNAGEWA
jgi:hypothetical protein